MPKKLRPSLRQLKNVNNLVGAEIGVAEGYNARSILSNLGIKKLYLVDHYPEGYRTSEEGKGQRRKNISQKILEPFEDKIERIYKNSISALYDIEDYSLDFVYIDGAHEFEWVFQDIGNYYHKVSPGGLVAGHDYKPGEASVIRAVKQFTRPRGLTYCTERWDWWFWRPFPNNFINKVWGYEEWLVNTDGYCCKNLFIQEGYQCSLHYHKVKDETFLINSGRVIIETSLEPESESNLQRREYTGGNSVRIPPGIVHRFSALENTTMQEVSTRHREDDVVRLTSSGPIDYP